VDYIGNDKNIYFVFGNKYKINVVGYQEIQNESVCVKLDQGSCIPYLSIGETQEFPSSGGEIYKVDIRIANVDYQFKLREGENFYFVIWQRVGGEKHVITSDRE